MRHLLQPRVLQLASLAALGSTLACYPRLALWLHHPKPVWYLAAVIFTCGITLWGFVFAWHAPYLHRPAFDLKQEPKLFLAVTLAGMFAAAICQQWLDPALRPFLPEEYPADAQHWLAALLFSLALTQLFLIFAPVVWLMRLCKSRWLAASLTVLFGTGVLALKLSSLATPVPLLLLAGLLAGRLLLGCLAVGFYLRGGVLLVWWWTLLLEMRHWLSFTSPP